MELKNKIIWVLAVMLITLSTLDIIVTNIALSNGASEGNPIILWMMIHLGCGWMIAKIIASICLAFVLALRGMSDMLVISIILMTIVVLWNLLSLI
jgi:hypothetical protein